MPDPALPRYSFGDLWARFELALFGKLGNTFERTQAVRLTAFFDELVGHLRAVEAAHQQERPSLFDNHHNALTCPYCNPNGFLLIDPKIWRDTLARAEAAEARLSALQGTQA